MIQLFIGFILGIFVATVGIGGLVNVADKGVDAVKTHSKELAR